MRSKKFLSNKPKIKKLSRIKSKLLLISRLSSLKSNAEVILKKFFMHIEIRRSFLFMRKNLLWILKIFTSISSIKITGGKPCLKKWRRGMLILRTGKLLILPMNKKGVEALFCFYPFFYYALIRSHHCVFIKT